MEQTNIGTGGGTPTQTIWEALSGLQGKLTPVKATKEVSFTANGREINFWYAPLDQVFSMLYPLCAEFGLYIRHELIDGSIEAIVNHKNGGEVRSGKIKLNDKGDMKNLGAEITYARRYTLSLVLGIATEEDKDAAGLSERTEALEKFAVKRITDAIANAKTEDELAKTAQILLKDKELLAEKKKTSLGLTEVQYDELLDAITKRKVVLHKKGDNE